MHAVRYRFSGEEYDRLAELDFFRDRRVELVDGEIIEMSPQSAPHIVVVRRLTKLFVPAAGEGRIVQVQLPVALGDSRPEPDISVVEDSASRATGADFVVEVADTSLRFDTTTKQALYAREGVADYWVVNLVDHEIWIFTEPKPDGYGLRARVRAGEIASSAHAPCAVALDALLEGI